MKTNIEYKEGKDLGKPNWRISVLLNTGSKVLIKTENFEFGFRTGEDWDKVYVSKNRGDTYENNVSVITKKYSRLEQFKPLIIEKFYEILEYNIKYHESEIRRINNYIDNYKNCLDCDLFKDKIREDKLNKLGI
jgi:hypothetical protein